MKPYLIFSTLHRPPLPTETQILVKWHNKTILGDPFMYFYLKN